MNTPVLEIKNLTKNYGKVKALDRLNLTINKGEVYGILGPNGSGKTTTLGIILGILAKGEGEFKWFGGKYGQGHRLKIGSILETPNFFPYLNAFDNLEIVRHIKKAPKSDFEELLKLVNLHRRRFSKFKTYSLGMKQRLAIAATLVGDPEVLIFDEPTNGLDPQGISEVRSILKKVADSGRTVIMASHILSEVEKICSHVAIIREGQLLATGPIGAILTSDLVVEVNSDDRSSLLGFLENTSWISEIRELENGIIECQIPENSEVTELSKLLYQKNIYPTHFVVRKPSLEQEFLAITSNSIN